MTASLTKADGTLSPVGELASYSLNHSAIPIDPRDSSGQIPTFSAVITNTEGDPKKLVGTSITLEDWTGGTNTGRVTAVNTNTGSGVAGLDAFTIFERLNTTQTTLPIVYSELATVDAVKEALEQWMLMCGIPNQKYTGKLLHYLDGKNVGKLFSYGYIADSISKFRFYGPPDSFFKYVPSAETYTNPIEVNPAQSVIIGGGFTKTNTLSEFRVSASISRNNTTAVYKLRRDGSTWTLREKVGTGAEVVLATRTWSPTNAAEVYYVFAQIKANATAGKVDITFRMMELQDVTLLPVYSDTTTTAVTSTLRNRPKVTSVEMGYDSAVVGSHTMYGAPDSYFMLESSTLQTTFPTSNYSITTGESISSDAFKQTMPYKIPGFTGNVWEKMRELCALCELDIYFEREQIVVKHRSSKRETSPALDFIPALDVPKSGISERISDRETSRSVEVLYRELIGSGYDYSNTLVWKADTVYSLEKGETKEELIQTDASFVFLHPPICVSGVPVPYTSAYSSYVITGNDGYIVDPQWWRDNGGSIKTYNTANSGEIRLVMQAPNTDTTRAPYRVSEGVADRPALYVKGYGLKFNEPKVLKSYTGAADAAQDVGVKFDSLFITRKLLAQNTAHKLANILGTTSSSIGLTMSQADLLPPAGSTSPLTPLGDSVYWKGSYYRIGEESIVPGSISVNQADRYNTVRVLNGEFATGKTIADWNTLHAGKTIRDTNVAPLPLYEG